MGSLRALCISQEALGGWPPSLGDVALQDLKGERLGFSLAIAEPWGVQVLCQSPPVAFLPGLNVAS